MCVFFHRSRFPRVRASGIRRTLRSGALPLVLILALVLAGSAGATSPDIRIPSAGVSAGETGGLRVVVDLPATKVFLDGEPEGLAHPDRPLVRSLLPAGPLRIAVRAEGAPPQSRDLIIRAGETVEARFLVRPRTPEVRRRLEAAAEALAADRLSEPPEAGAFHHFRDALALDPDLPEAREGLRTVLAAHRIRAERAESAGDFPRAEAEYRAALAAAGVLAEYPGAEPAEETAALAEGRDRVRRLSRPVAELLREADDLFRRERYLAPPAANAFERYRAVLARDPGNERARGRIREMAERYGRLAASAESEHFPRAAAYLRNRARLLAFLRTEAGTSVPEAEIAAAEARAEDLDRRVETAEALAREGDTYFIARRLLTPERGNAFGKYRAALERDPTNLRARERLGEMAEHYRESAAAAFEAGRLEASRAAYRRLETVTDFARSVFASGKLSAAASEARQRLEALDAAAEQLETAERYRAEGRRTSPEDDSALLAYRDALGHHPRNIRALEGLGEMMETALQAADAAETAGRFDEAIRDLARYVRMAEVVAFAADDPAVETARRRAERRMARLAARDRNRRLLGLRESLDRDSEAYRMLTERESRGINVAGRVTPVLRRIVKTLEGLDDLYGALDEPGMAEKRERARRTRAALEREIEARAEKAF